MGRLTFGAYLIHPVILRVSHGYIRQPIYATDMKIVNQFACKFTNWFLLIDFRYFRLNQLWRPISLHISFR